ncbi:polysaccharide deacetylase family protein [Streptomyces acidicola]|uniref:Polysaccharide deacetylase family protein n=1 Tax=Streptomyces acidicola TaxID=2596892 RepID=A0A5N8X747_9ACTN|nr:polysaccharide deacetylase family protein [Streptomyces acidicola]MPY54848.1 polysaccharide deacetylase family protein [Streptomyces acidicola]
MRLVRQNDQKRAKWTGVRGGVVVLAVSALASAACGGAVDPAHTSSEAERGAGAQRDHGRQEPLQAPPARALDAYASKLLRSYTVQVAATNRWGLGRVPLAPPLPPAKKPVLRTRKGFEVARHERDGLPPVVTGIPTREKVVFLTIDDGAEKDPAFLRMTSDLKIPYTAFLTDNVVRSDYGYFRQMRDRGVGLNNHTLRHRYLRRLPYAEQKREICGMQDVMEKQFGKRPALFRPPYGSYDRDTLRAAKACGIKAVLLWNEEVFPGRWAYREAGRNLHPGDIVLSHFRGKGQWKGTMPDMIRDFMKRVSEQGYAVARLEDYL